MNLVNSLIYSIVGKSYGYDQDGLNTLIDLPEQTPAAESVKSLLRITPDNDFVWKGITLATIATPYTATECRSPVTFNRAEWNRVETEFIGNWAKIVSVGNNYPTMCPEMVSMEVATFVTTSVSLYGTSIILEQGDYTEAVHNTSSNPDIIIPDAWPVWMRASGALVVEDPTALSEGKRALIRSWPSFPHKLINDFLKSKPEFLEFLSNAKLLSAYYEEEDNFRKTALIGLAFHRLYDNG